jgi:hypothetical protein
MPAIRRVRAKIPRFFFLMVLLYVTLKSLEPSRPYGGSVMFIELHDTMGNITLLCVEDIQRVRKGAHGGSDVFMNEIEGWVQVAESVAAVRDLIVKAGDAVTASQVSEGGGKPIRLQPVETTRDRD